MERFHLPPQKQSKVYLNLLNCFAKGQSGVFSAQALAKISMGVPLPMGGSTPLHSTDFDLMSTISDFVKCVWWGFLPNNLG
jgi:hypothetical protein